MPGLRKMPRVGVLARRVFCGKLENVVIRDRSCSPHFDREVDVGTVFGPTALLAALLMNAGPCTDCNLDFHAYAHGTTFLLPPGGHVTPPGPGLGWGYVNGAPDGYGWVDFQRTLPLGPDRIPDYFFPRQWAMPGSDLFLVSYYNPYLTRGQRYIPYTGGGGNHPAGFYPTGPSETPMHPYEDEVRRTQPIEAPIQFNGRVESPARASESAVFP
jgi:hypothetical protein